MRRSKPCLSRHRKMLPHAGQLIAVWGFYLILLLAEFSAAQPLLDISQGQVCDTEACKERAKMILASMNQAEHPCTDFYEYACGNWKKTHEIPDDKSELGNMEIFTDNVERDVKHILLNATYEEGECQNATNKAILAYRVCLCETVNETAKYNDLLKLLRKDGFTKWPIQNDEDSPYGNYNQLLNKTSFRALVAFDVSQDPKHVSSNVIYLDQIEFKWVGRNELINQTTEASAKIVAAYKTLIEKTAKIFMPNLTKEKLQQLSETILQFEAKLAKHSKADEDRRDFSLLYNEMNISMLSQKYRKIEWLNLLNNEFAVANITLKDNERVIVKAPDYIQEFEKILEGTNISTLYNYLYWTKIRNSAGVASKKLEELVFEFQKVAKGVKKIVPLWKKCTSIISNIMTDAIGRLYVDKMFDTKAKETVEKIVDVLNSTFEEMLNNNTWMDEPTRNKSLKKLQKMVAKIGYPSWILNETYLNGLYQYAPAVFLNYSFLNVLLGLRLNHKIQELLKLRQPYKKEHEWIKGAAEVNAFYHPVHNDITFPAGILQPPWFQDGVPSSLNMGAIGTVIGHEITHGFDDKGSQFDADGHLRNWWTDSARKTFLEKAQCFIEQYGNITVKEVNLTLNGINTQGENIADNSGLKAAYLAFKKFNDTVQGLPGLNLTGDQLFFVSNAMVWCKNIREMQLRFDVQYDTHSPAKYRVNLPMANSPDFLAVFGCSENSTMNIKKKCTMW